MAAIREGLQKFREFKNNPPKAGLLANVLGGVKKKIIVLIPASADPALRWALTYLVLRLIWSAATPGAIVTGAFFTLLAIFADQPGQLLRSVGNDPDVEAQFIEVTLAPNGRLKFTSRGADFTRQQARYEDMANTPPPDDTSTNPFNRLADPTEAVRTTEDLQNAIATITLQVWILLTKAVTAPDTARDSENRRWVKFLQQKRAKELFRLKARWLDIARDRIAEDISVRRLMVEILVEIGRIQGTKSRVVEIIADIGNYIAETGMAGFQLTIKYGIETRYPALALHEFQSDLSTIVQLMKLYQEQGERAPYLVLLEDSVQTKFSPGNYPLLWSYAMGVGTAIDRSMNGLNYNRPYLEPNYFKLGQDIVNMQEGNVDTKMAEELGLTDNQISDLKIVTQGTSQGRGNQGNRGRSSRFVPANAEMDSEDQDSDDDDDQGGAAAAPPVRRARPRAMPNRDVRPKSHGDLALNSFTQDLNSIMNKNPAGRSTWEEFDPYARREGHAEDEAGRFIDDM
nr:MAG: nucleocapsid protein [Jingmen bat jeilongvirus 7]